MERLPYYYTFAIRHKTILKFASWILINILIPASLLAADAELKTTISYLIFAIGFYALYELGYIDNDMQDKCLTQRLNAAQRQRIRSHFGTIAIAHALFFSISAAIAFSITPGAALHALCATAVAGLLFIAYNRTPQSKNIYVFPLLIAARYLAPAMIFAPLSLLQIVALLLIYPIEIIIERLGWTRFGITFINRCLGTLRQQHLFRVIYYALLTIIFSLFSVHYALIALFMLFYRAVLLIISRKRAQ